MKNLFFSALAALTLTVAAVPAYAASATDNLHAATTMQQQGAVGQE